MKKLCERFYDNTARIENMILLAGVLADEALPDAAEEFLEREDLQTIEECFGPLPAYIKEDFENEEKGVLAQWLLGQDKFGFLIQMATPVMTPHSKTAASYSWGHYRTKWFYGDTLNAALKAGFKWVKEQRKKERAKVKLKA